MRDSLEARPDLLRGGAVAIVHAIIDRVVDDYPVVAGLQVDIDDGRVRRNALSSQPASLRGRLGARLRRGRLDSDLAEGCCPEGAALRSFRARQLCDPVIRQELAVSLRRVVADVQQPGVLLGLVPVRRAAVLPWSEALLGLAERLEACGEVNPCGVARARFLLGDRTGPLYSCLSGMSIGEAVWWVCDGLGPCPPHRWGCPVIMKLDPEHVAWTCGRCGAIATSDDPIVRPA